MLTRKASPSRFTRIFTPDAAVPTIEAAEHAGDQLLRTARKVDGSFTWVKPQKRPAFQLKWVSPSALTDAVGSQTKVDDEFAEIVAGQKVYVDFERQIYPFASNYSGDQFGSWAGQLGDGRAVTLFRLGNYDLQLKGSGLTPYSRFADGLAVVRSSIREALCSEYLNALKVPTQRVLSLTLLPRTAARRESIERCAIVARMAESYIRIGTFQLHHAWGNREELRKLADHCIDLFEEFPMEGISRKEVPGGNRYFDFFRQASLRNAKMIAKCQAYGFLNGVLNTDNVSILGLSIDYGPFAFMDTFDPSFTPNHDDYTLRYGFKSAPMVMYWNCVKLGECLGELIGIGDGYNDPGFIANGTKKSDQQRVAEVATELIMGIGEEFQNTYEGDYQRLMMSRIGLTDSGKQEDLKLVESLLETLHDCEIDYNPFFRKLATNSTDAKAFIPKSRSRVNIISDEGVETKISDWLKQYNARVAQESTSAEERKAHMLSVNPKFVLRNSVLSNVIDLAQAGNWDAFDAVAKMALNPYDEEWPVDSLYAKRYTSEPDVTDRDSQLSCSS